MPIDLNNTGQVTACTQFNRSADYPYKEFWVSNGGDDSASGSRNNPLATIEEAWRRRLTDGQTRYAIYVDGNIWLDNLTLDGGGYMDYVGETYIEGLQDGTHGRYSSGVDHLTLIDVGNLYMSSFGYYGSLTLTQTDVEDAYNGWNTYSYLYLSNSESFGTITMSENNDNFSGLIVQGNTCRVSLTNTGSFTATNLFARYGGRLTSSTGNLTAKRITVQYNSYFIVGSSKSVTLTTELYVYNAHIALLGNCTLTAASTRRRMMGLWLSTTSSTLNWGTIVDFWYQMTQDIAFDTGSGFMSVQDKLQDLQDQIDALHP